MLTLRKIFESSWIERSNTAWIRALLGGEVLCMACVGCNSVSGHFGVATDKVARHLKHNDGTVSTHKKNVRLLEALLPSFTHPSAPPPSSPSSPPSLQLPHSHHPSPIQVAKYEASQLRIDAMKKGVGVAGPSLVDRTLLDEEKRKQALAFGAFAAGGHGAAGIPPSSIPKLVSQEMLRLLRNTDFGSPAASTLLETTLPNHKLLVQEYIKEQLKGTHIAISIDGGSARKLADGRKVIVIVAYSPERGEEYLLHVRVLDVHENSKIQAEVIHEVRVRLGKKG